MKPDHIANSWTRAHQNYAIFISLSSEFYLYIRWFLESVERKWKSKQNTNSQQPNNIAMSHYCQQLSNSVSLYARTLFLSDDRKSLRRRVWKRGHTRNSTRVTRSILGACGWNCVLNSFDFNYIISICPNKNEAERKSCKQTSAQSKRARKKEREQENQQHKGANGGNSTWRVHKIAFMFDEWKKHAKFIRKRVKMDERRERNKNNENNNKAQHIKHEYQMKGKRNQSKQSQD